MWPPDVPLLYTIFFENQATATAPAQTVVVTDQLSNNLDWSTLELVSIGFNQVDLTLPSGLTYYTGMSAVATDPNPVRIQANFNPNTGVITWVFESVDPVTHGSAGGSPGRVPASEQGLVQPLRGGLCLLQGLAQGRSGIR